MRTTAVATRVGRACLAGFFLVILSASLAGAAYGPRTTIGANYQQTSNTTSTDGFSEGTCIIGAGSCFILFQGAPQQKALIVQHVSCRVSVTAGGLLYASLLTRQGQNLLLKSTTLLPVHTTGTLWVVNSPVMHLLNVGERPVVFLFNSMATGWSLMECNISGQLKNP
jgi:hypothetical protein